MLWMFVGIAIIEVLIVHLFVALRWPVVGWPLTLLTGLAVVWLIAWTRSFRTHPHRLIKDHLQLQMGSLRRMHVPLAAVARVRTSWGPGEHNVKGATNLVPIAYPNRMIELSRPLQYRRRATQRVAIRVDDADSFDRALRGRGVEIQ